MRCSIVTLVIALTISATNAYATPVPATPCASTESVARANDALAPYMHANMQLVGIVLLDCRVQASRRLSCTASNQSQPDANLGAAAVAFANELEVCPGTPRHLMFPLTLRPESEPIAAQ
jgi:hypothetical protein